MLESTNKYTQMQLNQYNSLASGWSEENRDPVVGSFDAHNNWPDYENLFTKIDNRIEKIGLDFACGPGRNIVKYANRFKRLDGVDISPVNIENAKRYVSSNGIESNLYVSNGIGIDCIESNTYDFVMSTIALQHICVYERYTSCFKRWWSIYRSNGIWFTITSYCWLL
jgi:ubiquinone/menaquinone biosynthesis C-methylase UbiE